jgi:hypothetical protein
MTSFWRACATKRPSAAPWTRRRTKPDRAAAYRRPVPGERIPQTDRAASPISSAI